MALLRLPSEILLQIMDYVGTPYFHEDIGRLVVSKRWFSLAQDVRFKNFRLSQSQLQKFVSSPNSEMNRTHIQKTVQSFELGLVGYDGWDPEEEFPSNWTEIKEWLHEWTQKLNEDVTQVATSIKESRKLREIRIHAPGERHQFISFRHYYLGLSTVRAFLSSKSLTVLDMDLNHIYSTDGRFDKAHEHICEDISALLSTLKFLRLRMSPMCPRALELPHGIKNTHLRKVLVNLSHAYKDTAGYWGVTYANICGVSTSPARMKVVMEAQAKVIAAQMISPESVRVLTDEFMYISDQRDPRVKFLDVLTGERASIPINVDWDEDGIQIRDESGESD